MAEFVSWGARYLYQRTLISLRSLRFFLKPRAQREAPITKWICRTKKLLPRKTLFLFAPFASFAVKQNTDHRAPSLRSG
jgi:hypothetical protein